MQYICYSCWVLQGGGMVINFLADTGMCNLDTLFLVFPDGTTGVDGCAFIPAGIPSLYACSC